MAGTQDDLLWQDEYDYENIDSDAGDEYYSHTLSHEQVLQLPEESHIKSDFEGF